MNKTELIDAVRQETQLTKKDAENVINAILRIAMQELGKGEKVILPGFGTFEVHERAAREGRNPGTGEKVAIPAKRVVKFKNGKMLKEALT